MKYVLFAYFQASQPVPKQGDTATRTEDPGRKVAADSSPEDVPPSVPLPVEVPEPATQAVGRTSKDGSEKDQGTTSSKISDKATSKKTTEKCHLEASNDLPAERVQSVPQDIALKTDRAEKDQDMISNKLSQKVTNKESTDSLRGSKERSSKSEEHASASKVSVRESEESAAAGKAGLRIRDFSSSTNTELIKAQKNYGSGSDLNDVIIKQDGI